MVRGGVKNYNHKGKKKQMAKEKQNVKKGVNRDTP